MILNRRHFLKQSLATAIGATTIGSVDSIFNQASAAVLPNDYKSMVCVYLNGGCDTFNMLIPYSNTEYSAYKTARSGIEYERTAVLPISNDFGVHPLMPGLQNLFTNGEASFLANVGSLIAPVTKADVINGAKLPDSLGAHNTQTNYWHGDHSNAAGTTKDGWAGRMANEFDNQSIMPINSPIATGYNLFQSHAERAFYKLNGTGLINMDDQNLSTDFNSVHRSSRRNAMYAINNIANNNDSLLVQHAATLFQGGLELNLEAQRAISDISLATSFPTSNNPFETAAKLIGIRESLGLRRQIFYIQLNGFDTHFNQVNPSITSDYNDKMERLSQDLTAFNNAMHELDTHDSVVTFTASEFGRTLVSNRAGTDHAWGGNHVIMGGPVSGGNVFGEYPVLEVGGENDATTNAGRMIPTSSVTQYGATIAKWFGVPESQLPSVFPNLVNYSNNFDLGLFG